MGYLHRASVVLVAAVVGFTAAEASSPDGKRARRCHGIRVDPKDAPRDRRHGSTVISASQAKDLRLQISLPEELASLPVRVKLFTPRGSLFQVLEAKADADSEAATTRRRFRSSRRTRVLAASLPLAGTQITTHALFGEWRAEVYVDGAETPCTRPLGFQIEP